MHDTMWDTRDKKFLHYTSACCRTTYRLFHWNQTLVKQLTGTSEPKLFVETTINNNPIQWTTILSQRYMIWCEKNTTRNIYTTLVVVVEQLTGYSIGTKPLSNGLQVHPSLNCLLKQRSTTIPSQWYMTRCEINTKRNIYTTLVIVEQLTGYDIQTEIVL
jgi:hypothetical protein